MRTFLIRDTYILIFKNFRRTVAYLWGHKKTLNNIILYYVFDIISAEKMSIPLRRNRFEKYEVYRVIYKVHLPQFIRLILCLFKF